MALAMDLLNEYFYEKLLSTGLVRYFSRVSNWAAFFLGLVWGCALYVSPESERGQGWRCMGWSQLR